MRFWRINPQLKVIKTYTLNFLDSLVRRWTATRVCKSPRGKKIQPASKKMHNSLLTYSLYKKGKRDRSHLIIQCKWLVRKSSRSSLQVAQIFRMFLISQRVSLAWQWILPSSSNSRSSNNRSNCRNQYPTFMTKCESFRGKLLNLLAKKKSYLHSQEFSNSKKHLIHILMPIWVLEVVEAPQVALLCMTTTAIII